MAIRGNYLTHPRGILRTSYAQTVSGHRPASPLWQSFSVAIHQKCATDQTHLRVHWAKRAAHLLLHGEATKGAFQIAFFCPKHSIFGVCECTKFVHEENYVKMQGIICSKWSKYLAWNNRHLPPSTNATLETCRKWELENF